MLDYSTGNGRFAIAALEAFPGSRVHATDFQSEAPPALKTRGDILYFGPEALAASANQYDLIILRHVLEHSHDPVSLIAELGSHLTQDGIIYVEVPNLESACARLFGSNWQGWYVPRHIFHFNRMSLEKVIQSAGLDGKVGKTELPQMGNFIALATGASLHNFWVKLAGGVLHPIQLLIEALNGSSSCLYAIIKRRTDVPSR